MHTTCPLGPRGSPTLPTDQGHSQNSQAPAPLDPSIPLSTMPAAPTALPPADAPLRWHAPPPATIPAAAPPPAFPVAATTGGEHGPASHHHQRQPRSKPWEAWKEQQAIQQERLFSIITMLHAASAAALRQKLVQFATALHITVKHMTVKHITVLHMTVKHITVLHITVLHITVLHITVLHRTVLHITVLHITVIHITVIHITVIHIMVIHITVIHILQQQHQQQPMVLGFRTFPSCKHKSGLKQTANSSTCTAAAAGVRSRDR